MYKRKNDGVTLLEVMIVIAIDGILAAIALLSFQDMIVRNRLLQVTRALKSDMPLPVSRKSDSFSVIGRIRICMTSPLPIDNTALPGTQSAC
jgi:prepilin-type N-terminal cleavage/methylation domain-containing protein